MLSCKYLSWQDHSKKCNSQKEQMYDRDHRNRRADNLKDMQNQRQQMHAAREGKRGEIIINLCGQNYHNLFFFFLFSWLNIVKVASCY